ncbi:MAG: phage holin family protein [Patescibacteria group bacterium]|nr:phage holin family protein [Patescibacteria group bacterium]
MKKFFRMIIFSATAIYLTSLWNKGFIINLDFFSFLKASLFIALVYYLIVPVSKIILLPLNFLTLGLVSIVFYVVLFYLFFSNFGLIIIKPWYFSGGKFFNLIITPVNISYLANIFLSAFSISTIINLLEKIL